MKMVRFGAKCIECIMGQLVRTNAEGAGGGGGTETHKLKKIREENFLAFWTFNEALKDPGFIKFHYKLKYFPLDWKVSVH